MEYALRWRAGVLPETTTKASESVAIGMGAVLLIFRTTVFSTGYLRPGQHDGLALAVYFWGVVR